MAGVSSRRSLPVTVAVLQEALCDAEGRLTPPAASRALRGRASEDDDHTVRPMNELVPDQVDLCPLGRREYAVLPAGRKDASGHELLVLGPAQPGADHHAGRGGGMDRPRKRPQQPLDPFRLVAELDSRELGLRFANRTARGTIRVAPVDLGPEPRRVDGGGTVDPECVAQRVGLVSFGRGERGRDGGSMLHYVPPTARVTVDPRGCRSNGRILLDNTVDGINQSYT